MTPEDGFRLANLLALAGWLALTAGVALRRERLRVLVAWRVVPVLLALAYLALLVLAPREGTGGGFGTLAAVAALFESRWALLAGWIHYLCFDLMVGCWIAAEVLRRGLPRWLLVPCLPLTFLLGPLGLLVFWAGVATLRRRGA
jgi:hypothetical protein